MAESPWRLVASGVEARVRVDGDPAVLGGRLARLSGAKAA